MSASQGGFELGGEGFGGHAACGGGDFGALGVEESDVGDTADTEFLGGDLVGGLIHVEVGPDKLGFVRGDFLTGINLLLDRKSVV